MKIRRTRTCFTPAPSSVCFASYDGGRNWLPLNLKNLPNVAIHDIVVHPRENDLILATHGRSLWIFDDATVIQQMTPADSRRQCAPVFRTTGVRYASTFTRYGIGDKVLPGRTRRWRVDHLLPQREARRQS